MGLRGPITFAVSLVIAIGLIPLASSAGASRVPKGACPSTPHINGFDVSHFDGSIMWPSVTCEHFVYAEATDGTSYVDTTFATNRSGARVAGVSFGGYANFEPSEDPVTQANEFLSVDAPRPGDLPPVLSLTVTDGVSAAVILSRVASWINTVKAATGVTPAIYTYPSFWISTLGDPSTYTSAPLWIANYGVSSPTVPASNWGGNGWTLWEYSDSGTVTGVPDDGATYLNYFSGSSLKTLQTSAATTVSIATLTSNPVVGQPITLSVKVSGAFTGTDVPAPSGKVTVLSGATSCKAVVSGTGGEASGSCTLAEMSSGSHTFTASYPGDANWDASVASSGATVKVGTARSKTLLTLSKSKLALGDEQIEKLSVVVSPQYAGSTPTGKVTIKVPSMSLCKAKLSSGVATCVLSRKELGVGTYQLIASYSGSTNFTKSTSGKKTLKIVK